MQQDKQFQPIRNTRTMHKLNIPTPKSYTNNAYEHSNTLHYTTWKDDTTHMWTRAPNGKWDIPPEASYKDTPPHTTPHIPTLNGAKVSIDTIKAATHQPVSTTVRIIPIQDDIGANQNVTHIRSIIHGYVDIEPYPIGGVKADDIAIVCTGKGYLPWLSKEGVCTMVPILFSKEVDGTIVSPTTIVLHYKEKYTGFVIETNTDDGTGVLRLVHRDGVHHLTFPMTMYNSLWFHEYKPPHLHSTTPPHAATVNRMNDACLSNLWHGRLAHAGEDVADEIHKHVIGINKPLRRNPFHKCGSCLPAKMSKQPHKRTAKHKRQSKLKEVIPPSPPLVMDDPANADDILYNGVAGQHFHMDFGFVRGSDYSMKRENAPTITSIDGYNSYLIIVDRVTRYLWLFLTASKAPPLTIVDKVLTKFKCKNPHRTVRTDQGGELGRSHEFQKVVVKNDFLLELTGAAASAQNAHAESPNRYLANMMRCLLHAADLGSEYWSFALIHAAYVKNRIPHTYIRMTPYEALTGAKPDITNLRTFGCRVFVRKPNLKKAKLDYNTSNGIFVGYTATTKNIYYIDDATSIVKIGTHALFDEAHFTAPRDKQPLAAQALQSLGYSAFRDEFKNGKFKAKHALRIKMVHKDAIAPTQIANHSIGMQIHTIDQDTVIPPGSTTTLSTGLVPDIPTKFYMEISSPPPPHTHKCEVRRDIRDSTHIDQIRVTLTNTTPTEQTIVKGECIAYMIYKKAVLPSIKCKHDVTQEPDTHHAPVTIDTTTPQLEAATPPTITDTTDNAIIHHPPGIDIIPFDDDELTSAQVDDIIPIVRTMAGPPIIDSEYGYTPPLVSGYDSSESRGKNNSGGPDNSPITSSNDIVQPSMHTRHTPHIRNMHTDVNTPLQIYMSNDPFEDVIAVEISTHGDHKTLGMVISNNTSMGNRPQLTECAKSTPAARIPKWRSMLRNAFPTEVDGKHITTTEDVIDAVRIARQQDKASISVNFSIISKIAMHPQEGIPVLYHDQMNVIATHVAEIKDTLEEQGARHQKYLEAIVPTIAAVKSAKKKAKLTRRILKVQRD